MAARPERNRTGGLESKFVDSTRLGTPGPLIVRLRGGGGVRVRRAVWDRYERGGKPTTGPRGRIRTRRRFEKSELFETPRAVGLPRRYIYIYILILSNEFYSKTFQQERNAVDGESLLPENRYTRRDRSDFSPENNVFDVLRRARNPELESCVPFENNRFRASVITDNSRSINKQNVTFL